MIQYEPIIRRGDDLFRLRLQTGGCSRLAVRTEQIKRFPSYAVAALFVLQSLSFQTAGTIGFLQKSVETQGVKY